MVIAAANQTPVSTSEKRKAERIAAGGSKRRKIEIIDDDSDSPASDVNDPEVPDPTLPAPMTIHFDGLKMSPLTGGDSFIERLPIVIMQGRDDYEYLLRLAIIYLGGTPPGGIKFRPPMALSSARFMGRIIYCLTIEMFAKAGEFEVSSDLLPKLRDANIFFVTIYLPAWFSAFDALSAPRHDLELMKSLLDYKAISPIVSQIAVDAFKNHLWYLSEHCVAIALFDPNVPVDTKRLMVNNLSKKCQRKKRIFKFTIPKNLQVIATADLSIFVNEKTLEFFKIVGLNMDFLSEDPHCWPSLPSYAEAQSVVRGLQVVNDCAERAVALVKSFNNSITKDELDFQNLLLVMKKERASGDEDKERTLKKYFELNNNE
ncbi:putative nitrate/nitrite antiporter NarK1 [Frankliniella fusca]|uniref:Nitrate/nitrite antiporter NarK1 n=1 Tax=Frankliniella fusca TaxID=407009 RepID=A0AAE1HBW1_9NEOP|nr:putative nitrate/nitrite antiporter NarK1 [Frankliniella fusca]